MLQKAWLIALLCLTPACAHAESTTSIGRLTGIDGQARRVTLEDGSTFYVNRRVKLSSRSIGEFVVITHRADAKGREITRIRRAPDDPKHNSP